MKYKAGVKARIQDEADESKAIEKNARLGKSALEVQIAQLKSEVVKKETKVETAEDDYNDSKFAMPFDLEMVDNCEFELKKAKKGLKEKQDDLKSREALLKELF